MHFVEMPNAPHVDVTGVAGSRQALKWIIHSSSLTTSSSVPDMRSAALGRPFEGSPQNSDTRSDAPLSISTTSDERKKIAREPFAVPVDAGGARSGTWLEPGDQRITVSWLVAR